MTRTRIDAGTDIAKIGVWDVSRNDGQTDGLSIKRIDAMCAEDSRQGNLFLLQLGGDWGGAIDVYVDAELEPELRAKMMKLPGKFLLSAPSGRLIVGGAEDYRSQVAQITSEASIVDLAPGDYALEAYALLPNEEGEIHDAPPDEVFESLVGAENYAYYQTRLVRTLRGFWLFLLFIPITYLYGWIAGLVASLAIVLGYFSVNDWLLKRDPRYMEMEEAMEAKMQEARDKMPPIFAFTLTSRKEAEEMTGGILDMSDGL